MKEPIVKLNLKAFLLEEPIAAPTTQAPLAQPAPSETLQPQNVSLDQKVDHFLIQYEREAMPMSNPQGQGAGGTPPAQSLMEWILSEADDDLPPTDAPADDASGGDPLGLDTPPTDTAPAAGADDTAPPSELTAKINLDQFAARLARLAQNYDALLDPKTTIVRRAQAYITLNYNAAVAKELMIILETQYQLTGEPRDPSDGVEAPMAAGAAGNLVGAGGGGA